MVGWKLQDAGREREIYSTIVGIRRICTAVHRVDFRSAAVRSHLSKDRDTELKQCCQFKQGLERLFRIRINGLRGESPLKSTTAFGGKLNLLHRPDQCCDCSLR